MLLIFIGHSHIEAIRAALRAHPRPGVLAVNLRQQASSLDLLGDLKPDAIALCMGGNAHNLLGLFEHPQPFSIGSADRGAVPEGDRRTLIPYQVVYDTIVHALRAAIQDLEATYAKYPDAMKILLNAPPPVGDEAHIRAYPDIFQDKLHLGVGHADLRLGLYRVQTDVFRDLAIKQKAIFVEPISEVLDSRGLLAKEYCLSDPTHANSLYGEIMLQKVVEMVEDAL